MMQYKGYVGKVELDSEAGILHGEVVGIKDVVTFEGKSVQEIERAFRQSIDDYLAFCKTRGEQPEKPFSGQFIVRVNSGLHRQLSTLARASGKSLNALVEEYLTRGAASAMPSSSGKRRPSIQPRPPKGRGTRPPRAA